MTKGSEAMLKKVLVMILSFMLVFSVATPIGNMTVEAKAKNKYRCTRCKQEFKTLAGAHFHLLRIDGFNGMHTFVTIK